ncbi:MAG: hypothetical protein ACPHUF_03525 [Gammaproteobacteria bacterium]|tara:strand:- start:89 stop:424 length:336 start_codon:yes stop_codon:yes gene_type:complete
MKHVVVVLTEPVDGRDDEYNEYYENLHLDEVLQTTGWDNAQRFRLVDQQGIECPHPYLAFYETEAEDSAEILKRLNDTRKDRVQSEALNYATAGLWIFAETGPRHEAADSE